MNPPRPARRPSRGNAIAPILLILGALVISGLVFFFFTRQKIEQARIAELQQEQAAVAAQEAQTRAKTATPAPDKKESAAPVATNPPATPPKPAVAPGPAPFARPVELGQQLARVLAGGDLAVAAKMLAPENEPKALAALGVLEKIFHDLAYKPSSPESAQMIGQVENLIRIAVPLIPGKPGAPAARLILDLERDPRRGWKVAQVHLPTELESALAALPAAQPPVAMPASTGAPALPSIATPAGAGQPMTRPFFVVDRVPDALAFASDFVTSLLKLDYQGARRFVDQERIPPVKLAALCIVFEEGKYRLSDDRALVATVATDTTSWVITRVNSGVTNENTEFGLEMEKVGQEWRVGGLNLSKLLSDNAKATSLNDVPYSPLVMNPKGGESIALFFELNQAELHPRAQKQLDIVVSILKASPQKKLKIGGYTDALGSDDYNLNLSKRRAEAVKQYFLAHGVPLAQVETTGFGKALPLSPNVKPDGSDNPEGRSRNRRAEILLDF